MLRRIRTLPVAVGAGVVPGLALATTLVAQVLWVAHRPLPAQLEVDASGPILPSVDPTRPLTVVALGDSTLTGPGLTAGTEVWLPAALTRLRSPIDLVSLAVGGSRVADVARRLDDALDLRPDLVVLAVGANDALHGTRRTVFRRHFTEVVARLAADVPAVAVANIGDLGNIARVPAPLRSVLRWRARTMCTIIEEVVAAHDHVELLDVTVADDVFRQRTVYTADLFHPGPLGHAAWADAALPGLQRAVLRCTP